METKNEQPANPAPPTAGMNRKVLLFAAIIFIVIIAVVGVGIYVLTSGGGGGGINSGGNSAISGANSLQFSVSTTTNSGASQGTFTYTYYAKNIGASNLMLRIEYTDSNLNYVYIVNGAEQKAWVETNGIWTDLSSGFQNQLTTWNNAFESYTTYLADYASGGAYTYTAPNGDVVEFSGIIVNPTLADSLFTQ